MKFEVQNMESKEGTDALFQYATEGILVTDQRGTIVRINPSAASLFGYSAEELTGSPIETLVPKRLAADHARHRAGYAEQPHARSMGLGMELKGLKKDGSEFPVEISLSPYTNSEGTFVIAFIVDVTLRRQAEERLKNYSADLEKQVKNRTLILEEAVGELEKTKKELHHALEKERELNEMKSRFVSMASHEFRTPLTTMMSSLSLILRYGEMSDLPNQVKHVRKIKSSINNLTDILNDFLSVSKLEEGRVANHPENVDLKDLLTDIISEMQAMTTGKQTISLDYTGAEDVFLDPRILKNILFNLISNALKFSPDGGIVKLKTTVLEREVTLSVKDNGIGISREDQEHLFERFFRGQNATHIQGTGLGLNIVAQYVRLMNGTIEMESEEKKGTKVTICLPL